MREREERNAYHNKILSHWSLTLLLTLFLIDKKYIRRGFLLSISFKLALVIKKRINYQIKRKTKL